MYLSVPPNLEGTVDGVTFAKSFGPWNFLPIENRDWFVEYMVKCTYACSKKECGCDKSQ